MADREHLEILKLGAEEWNAWRRDIGAQMVLDLMDADLSGADLTLANLGDVFLTGANLSGANLYGVDLSGADLSYSNLRRAHLHSVDLWDANLTAADLAGANLSCAHLFRTDLSDVDLSGADLTRANISGAKLRGTKVKGAKALSTVFANVDLREVKGLESIQHVGPSEMSISTLYCSQGQIPEVFLRGCGVPVDFITYARSLTTNPIDFYSCFISYSSKDQEFAERLHADLQAKGVRVWFARQDMKIGARIRTTIDESIRVYDKLLLVLSEHSVSSQWVEQEVETALRKERQASGTVLFPVRLDDSVFEIGEGWPALVKDTRHVGDFTDWKDHDSYQKAFDRLLRDLKAEA